MRIDFNNKLSTVLLIWVLLFISACSSFEIPEIQPWVAPYEREYLADPIMSFNKDPLSNRNRQKVYNTREAARGAGYGQGGGCGCN